MLKILDVLSFGLIGATSPHRNHTGNCAQHAKMSWPLSLMVMSMMMRAGGGGELQVVRGSDVSWRGCWVADSCCCLHQTCCIHWNTSLFSLLLEASLKSGCWCAVQATLLVGLNEGSKLFVQAQCVHRIGKWCELHSR